MRWSMRRTEVRFPFLSSFVFFDADVMCRERIGALIDLSYKWNSSRPEVQERTMSEENRGE